MIERVSRQGQLPAQQPKHQRPAGGASFGDALRQELARSAQAQPQPQQQGIAFSKHAISRAQERGIEVTPDLLSQLNGSIERAQAKGATNILAMGQQNAFIINVPSARVITAITQDEMKENIFTNIDGAVFL